MTREDAISQLKITSWVQRHQGNSYLADALDIAIKAAEQESEWIPVNQDKYPEGYPAAFQEVWMTDGYGDVVHKPYGGERNIKAWMPYIVPEPYKEENKTNKTHKTQGFLTSKYVTFDEWISNERERWIKNDNFFREPAKDDQYVRKDKPRTLDRQS